MKFLMAFLMIMNLSSYAEAHLEYYATAEVCENFYCKEVLKYRSDYEFEWVIVLKGRAVDIRYKGGYESRELCVQELKNMRNSGECDRY